MWMILVCELVKVTVVDLDVNARVKYSDIHKKTQGTVHVWPIYLYVLNFNL